MFQPSNRVKVSILATSRQLYEECNLLIWHTNTFSFEVPTAFTIFLESLNTQQMRNIRNLQIRPLASQLTFPGQHGIYRNGNGDRIVGIQQWNLGDSRGQLIQRLHAVKSLRIQLKYVACGDVIEPSRFQLELALSNLQVLRSIPLEYATVDFDIRRLPGYADKTVDPKIKQLAAEFQRMLLDPAGPEKVKEFGVPKRPTRLHSQFPGNIFSSENIYFYMGSEWPE
ncbi:MAG: hypothetical protein OHK93_003091 [Ramalina farinacea]|uniref:DUF7730 domain-containing protein n=1 Tax=Ramalina farinacea TaxID=258253 RepID=A0AA43TZH6_9LECA|nr:hypothetical protein [Ramalina farinacea]